MFSNHLEWEHVATHLTGYHLIVPDLTQHSRSKHIQPLSFEHASDKVASLMAKHAHGGRAHMVGLSLGGFVTMEIVRRHPDIVHSAFVTGTTPIKEWQAWITA